MATLTRTLLIASFCFSGCGDDAPPGSGVRCTSGSRSCSCTGEACRCISGEDCNVECDDVSCGLTCTMEAKCNGHSTATLTLVCSDMSECKGNGGDRSFITCEHESDCDLKAGANSTAVCRDTSHCKINVGMASNVLCEEMADCDIKCDADCRVTCAATATCNVTCGPDDAGVGGMMCPDGRILCGSGC